MKVCKIKPDTNTCCCCIDAQLEFNKNIDCTECLSANPEYEILKVGVTIFGRAYALVLANGKIEKVSINRLYDVREKTNFEMFMDERKYDYEK